MVQVTQTEEEINISIELNRLVTRKPDIVLLPFYIKFNSPPIFFERHLAKEIDEVSSFCRIFKNEARIVLIKKEKGQWTDIFQNLTKEEQLKKRLEISDLVVERNKERDQKTLERFDQKRRAEVEKEIQRENAMRERVKQFQENACRDALMVGVRKETHSKQKLEPQANTSKTHEIRIGTPVARSMAAVRNCGKINVSFSKFALPTPKRESQETSTFPFKFENKCQDKDNKASLDTVDE